MNPNPWKRGELRVRLIAWLHRQDLSVPVIIWWVATGAVNFLLQLWLIYLGVKVMQPSVAFAVAFAITGLSNFIMRNSLVWKHREATLKSILIRRLPLAVLVILSGAVINSAVQSLVRLPLAGIRPSFWMLALLVAALPVFVANIVTMVWNFWMEHKVVFVRSALKAAEEGSL